MDREKRSRLPSSTRRPDGRRDDHQTPHDRRTRSRSRSRTRQTSRERRSDRFPSGRSENEPHRRQNPTGPQTTSNRLAATNPSSSPAPAATSARIANKLRGAYVTDVALRLAISLVQGRITQDDLERGRNALSLFESQRQVLQQGFPNFREGSDDFWNGLLQSDREEKHSLAQVESSSAVADDRGRDWESENSLPAGHDETIYDQQRDNSDDSQKLRNSDELREVLPGLPHDELLRPCLDSGDANDPAVDTPTASVSLRTEDLELGNEPRLEPVQNDAPLYSGDSRQHPNFRRNSNDLSASTTACSGPSLRLSPVRSRARASGVLPARSHSPPPFDAIRQNEPIARLENRPPVRDTSAIPAAILRYEEAAMRAVHLRPDVADSPLLRAFAETGFIPSRFSNLFRVDGMVFSASPYLSVANAFELPALLRLPTYDGPALDEPWTPLSDDLALNERDWRIQRQLRINLAWRRVADAERRRRDDRDLTGEILAHSQRFAARRNGFRWGARAPLQWDRVQLSTANLDTVTRIGTVPREYLHVLAINRVLPPPNPSDAPLAHRERVYQRDATISMVAPYAIDPCVEFEFWDPDRRLVERVRLGDRRLLRPQHLLLDVRSMARQYMARQTGDHPFRRALMVPESEQPGDSFLAAWFFLTAARLHEGSGNGVLFADDAWQYYSQTRLARDTQTRRRPPHLVFRNQGVHYAWWPSFSPNYERLQMDRGTSALFNLEAEFFLVGSEGATHPLL